ncbi:PAS/PAC sensor hybrid histidine kinase [Caballeronia temeraria]|uniref:histidine kinase n=1 Tax=Caballeronia temeraria TaxID=1777137 RepID=A0A158DWX4_9BURK|nr:ATP-binding protein [Caballeronia temeraria]SAK98217.1 PAS/PAC sensor hybrid histidine kinase [Caballeronia temeraria]
MTDIDSSSNWHPGVVSSGTPTDDATFRLLVNSVREYAIFRLSENGIVTTWNPGAQRVKGYSADEIIGRHFSVFYTPDQRAKGRPEEVLHRALSSGQYSEEGWRVRKDGSLFWASIVISVIRDGDGKLLGFAKVVRDMTERRRLEELEASSRRMNEFLAMLGHELRNPLAPIRNAVGLLQQQSLPTPDILRRTRDIVDRQLAHMTRLVDDLLDAGRITTGKVRVTPAPVAIQDVIDRAVEAVRPKVEAKNQTLDVRMPGDEPVIVNGDVTRLVQVIYNVLDNASKYTQAGGLIQLEALHVDWMISISIEDNGRGIAPESLDLVFDLFAQEKDPDASTEEGGLGIGLTLARSLVELHGGRIEVVSPGPGRGTKFTVWLPAYKENPKFESPEEHLARPCSRPVKVLVVDDNHDSADSMWMLLEALGHEALRAYSGAQAIDIAASFRPDLVLLDLSMPLLTGYEAIGHLREVARNDALVVAAVTGFGQVEDRERTRAAGFDAHLTKPVGLAELESVLTLAEERMRDGGRAKAPE